MGNDDVIRRLDEFERKFQEFIMQYELDMRGNKKINGEKGIVNEIREIKQFHKDYPSILWLLKRRTLRTTLSISAIILIISFISILIFISAGPLALIKTFLNLLGIPLL